MTIAAIPKPARPTPKPTPQCTQACCERKGKIAAKELGFAAMKWVRWSVVFVCAALTACATRTPDGQKLPDAPRFLFWSADEQPLGYRYIERIFPTSTVRKGEGVSPLPLHMMKYDVRYKYKG